MSQSYTTSTIPFNFHAPHETGHTQRSIEHPPDISGSNDDEYASSILHCMLAGGFGGIVGDSAMHSLDTVKTRQQGFSNNIKYKNMIPAYTTILREEGFFRGLYGGYYPAVLGSFPSTAAFFGTYEFTKRKLINDLNFNETISYLVAGVLGDLASSIFYVPSELLKTRLQLQGRYNNPYTKESGYNYKGLFDAVRSITKNEGFSTFTFGYKETLFRDLPFSALQFAFYERFRQLAIYYNKDDDLPIPLELATGAAGGGLAGILTTPLDVIKTRIQTSSHASETSSIRRSRVNENIVSKIVNSSTLEALLDIYKKEGVLGMFSGVGPRFIWTGIQSSIMLLLYQVSLKKLDSMMDDNLLEA